MTMDPINITILDNKQDIFIPSGDHCVEDVLFYICDKHGLDASRYILSYENYFLSNEFRLKTLNLHKDAHLKLVEDFRPTEDMSVTITLRIKDSHISAKFHPDVTLWKVVENLVAGVTLKIPSSVPLLIRKGVEYIGRDDLEKVTPRSLGFTSGYLLFRFLVIENAVLSKRTGGLLGSSESLQFEFNQGRIDSTASIVHRVVSTKMTSKGDEQVITFYPGIARRNSSVFGEINCLGERNAVACRLPNKKLTARQKERRDNFYDMHVEDVKTMFKLVEEKRKELKERLIKNSDPVERKPETEKKFTVIRIQFPDKTVLQGFFDANETIKEVAEFIKLYRRVQMKFQLIMGPPKVTLQSEKSLAEYGLVPTGKVYYKIIDDEHPMHMAFLKEKVLRRLTTHEAACYAAALCHHRVPEVEDKKEERESRRQSDPESRDNPPKKGLSISSLPKSKSQMLRPFESRISHFKF